MKQQTRFRFLTKLLIQSIVLIIAIAFARMLIGEYAYSIINYLSPLKWILGFLNTLAIISIIAIGVYYLYVGGSYLSTSFFLESRIPVHEALFHGYTDLAYVYSRLRKYDGTISYDTRTKSIMIERENEVFVIIVRDIFGRLEANVQNETWYVVSKKRKQFGKIKYMKRKPIPNPLYEDSPFEFDAKKDESKQIHKLVCLTGLRVNTFDNEQINTVYEIEGLLDK